MIRGWDGLRALAFLFVAILIGGFMSYAIRVARYDPPPVSQRADAIIVLTGDTGRLATGGQLLRDGRSPQLLISGVHPSATVDDIKRHTGLTDAEFSCCVVLGREATDTIGNAREAGMLVRENGYRSLIIVTSDYHLPRSLLEMRTLMPGVELIPYPVRTPPPWHNARAARLWLQEYAKYTAVWVRYSVAPRAEQA
ncbi:YdcF family protein [Maricaulis sp.]|jgi:uncharacterized SAM-binding protein YcdF (DUF218 family)|uniref:YdcF family protein n=1 Tax=Maricaulis sp. TaxID=1486257 RepID=UPI002633A72D|nr:YdcF family protein [Maricaulis sp.]